MSNPMLSPYPPGYEDFVFDIRHQSLRATSPHKPIIVNRLYDVLFHFTPEWEILIKSGAIRMVVSSDERDGGEPWREERAILFDGLGGTFDPSILVATVQFTHPGRQWLSFYGRREMSGEGYVDDRISLQITTARIHLTVASMDEDEVNPWGEEEYFIDDSMQHTRDEISAFLCDENNNEGWV